MTSRDQEPWQRRVRQPRDQRGWDIVPSVEPPRGFPAPQERPSLRQEPDARPGYDPGQAVTVWRASASFGKLIGFLLALGFVVLTLVSFWRFRVTDGVDSLLAAAAALTCAASAIGIIYLLRGLTTIRYIVGRDSITVVWMGQRRVIPFDDIVDVVYEPRGSTRGRGYELFWPGYHVSTMQMRDGAWHSVATQSPTRRIRIVTRRGIHAISPYRPILFLGDLARRRQLHATGMPYDTAPAPIPPPRWTPPVRATPPPAVMPRHPSDDTSPDAGRAEDTSPSERQARTSTGPREPSPPARVTTGWLHAYLHAFRERLLGDSVASALVAVGVMIPLLMAAFLYSQYEGIADVVPLHWNAHGDVDAVGGSRELWRLPIIAVLLLILNTTLATALMLVDRFMARFLVAITPVAQVIVFVALIRAAT